VRYINPTYADAWTNKGSALAKQGKLDDAIKAFDEAIRLDPKHAEAWQVKGLVLEVLGRKVESDAAFAKAKELVYTN
jgi:Flp pilus assembly protein TadD